MNTEWRRLFVYEGSGPATDGYVVIDVDGVYAAILCDAVGQPISVYDLPEMEKPV